MALIICPECEKKVSDEVENCIHCGYPIKKKKETTKQSKEENKQEEKKNNKKFIYIIVILAIIIIAIVANMNKVKIPYLYNATKETAEITLQNNSLIPIIEYEYSDEVEEGKVIYTNPGDGSKVNKNSNVYVTISKGPQIVYSKDSTIEWYHLGTVDDKWEFSIPYIEEEYLTIECTPTFGTGFTWKSEGFGNASINDTFDKTVPVKVEYENQTVTAGVEQPIKIKISTNDLEVKKPTTLYIRLVVLDNEGIEKNIRINFSISW